MILYTPLNLDEVLEGYDDSVHREFIQYGGISFYATKEQDGSYKIDQLLSTNPNDFINPNFRPGNFL